MKVRYIGTRPSVSTVLSNRGIYYFGLENNYTVDITNPRHINELLRSAQHRFEIVVEEPKVAEPPKEEKKVTMPKPEKKKRGRRKKNA